MPEYLIYSNNKIRLLPLLYMTNIRQLSVYFTTKVELFCSKNALLRYYQ